MLLMLAACAPENPLSVPEAGPEAAESPARIIMDGTREGGNPGFFWHTPIAIDQPPAVDDFAEELYEFLTVEVCLLDSGECSGEPLAQITSETGEDGRRLAMHVSDGVFATEWGVTQEEIDFGSIYRVSVLAGGAVLGFADLDPVETFEELMAVDRTEYGVFSHYYPMPIVFSVGAGALPEEVDFARVVVPSDRAISSAYSLGRVGEGGVIVSRRAAQLLFVTDADGDVTGLSLSIPGSAGPSVIPVGPDATAVGLLFLAVGVLETDPALARDREQLIRSRACFGELRSALGASDATLVATLSRPDVVSVWSGCVADVLEARPGGAAAFRSQSGSAGGVEVNWDGENSPVLTNRAWRWVAVDRREELGGGSTSPFSSVRAPGLTGLLAGASPISWGSLFTLSVDQPTDLVDETFQPEVGFGSEYWFQGPGALAGESRPGALEENLLPNALGLVHYFLLPMIDLGVGLDLELGEAGRIAGDVYELLRTAESIRGPAALAAASEAITAAETLDAGLELTFLFIKACSANVPLCAQMLGTSKASIAAFAAFGPFLVKLNLALIGIPNLVAYTTQVQFAPRVATVTIEKIPDLPPSPPGLIAHYPFDGDFQDATGNFADASPTGGVSFSSGRPTIPGQGLYFDGDISELLLADGLGVLPEGTVSLWVRADNPTGRELCGRTDLPNATPFHCQFNLFAQEGGSLRAQFNGATGAPIEGVDFIVGSEPRLRSSLGGLDSNDWRLYTFTWGAFGKRAYVDGELVGESSGALASRPGGLVVGANGDNVLRFRERLRGWVDDVQIYDFALDDDAIRGLCDACGASAPMPDPVLHFPLDGNGEEVVGGFDLTTIGAPAAVTGYDGSSQSALRFDGVDDYLIGGALDLLDGYHRGAVTVWFRSTDPSAWFMNYNSDTDSNSASGVGTRFAGELVWQLKFAGVTTPTVFTEQNLPGRRVASPGSRGRRGEPCHRVRRRGAALDDAGHAWHFCRRVGVVCGHDSCFLVAAPHLHRCGSVPRWRRKLLVG